MKKHLDVAVGVVINKAGLVLLGERVSNTPGGLWEFPGGKLELGETGYDALVRELKEEIDIEVVAAEPLIQLDHVYDTYSVTLYVWRVTAYDGEPTGKEGQAVRWASIDALPAIPMPGANQPIIDALT